MAFGFRMWGWGIGPLTQSARAITNAAGGTQLLNSSTAELTPNPKVKTLVVTNPAANADTVWIGKTGVTTSAFLHELAPGSSPFVVDCIEEGMDTFFAISSVAGPVNISVAQGG